MVKGQEVIRVEGLHKNYGQVKAVDGISFQVHAGEIFGMVGPNGSGKTTTIECIEGLRRPDEGSVEVLGLNPWDDARELRERAGIQLQSANLPRRMRVDEAMDLFASFYPKSCDWGQLLEELGLGDKRKAYFSQLSGGQQQRVFVALALVNNPEIVFLDELTTGLDPRARLAIWDLIREIRANGTTVFLTTHYMDEAEQLCDRVGILDSGRIIALDSPAQLVKGLGRATRITFSLNGRTAMDDLERKPFNPARIGVLDGVQRIDQEGDQVTVYGQGEGILGAVVYTLEADRVPYHDLRTEGADLEDVFLALTGREVHEIVEKA